MVGSGMVLPFANAGTTLILIQEHLMLKTIKTSALDVGMYVIRPSSTSRGS
jgi:hypothetical protein